MKGNGLCLGLTFTKNGPRIRLPKTREEEYLIHIINEIVAACDSLGDLFSTSLQLNKNTVSSLRRDANNMGISAITTLGNFEGGRFLREAPPQRTPGEGG